MSERSEYSEWAALREFYLEDSYVLEIVESSSELLFRMELVLREGHPGYHSPRDGEQYCYEAGELKFRGTRDVRWIERNEVLSFDATGKSDLGNIDQLYIEGGRYTAAGDWGRVSFVADSVAVNLQAGTVD